MQSPIAITKPNWKVIILLTLATLSSGITMTFPFSYTPAMITHFGYSDKQRGYYNGILTSVRFFGSIIGCFAFSILSDRYGRRPIIICTLFGQALMNLLFGFSPNFTMAAIVRFITGLFGGIVPIVKTVILEISDDTNQSTGLSCANSAFAIGFIIGSFSGGPLAEPLVQYAGVFPESGLLQQFPYCLPSIVFSFLCVLVFIANLSFLPETKGLRREKAVDKVVGSKEELNLVEIDSLDNPYKTTIKEKEKLVASVSMQHLPLKDFQFVDEERVISKSTSDLPSSQAAKKRSSSDHSMFDSVKRTMSELVLDNNLYSPTYQTKSYSSPRTNWQQFISLFDIITYCFKNHSLRLSILAYGWFGFAYVMGEEATTLYLYNNPLDGLGFMPKNIAVIGGIYSFAMIPLTIVLPKLERKFGFLRLHLIFILPCLLSILLLPFVRFLYNNTAQMWITLILIGLPSRIVVLCIITCENMAVNNSVMMARAGSVNGISTVFSNLCRGLGTLVGSACFQWSVTRDLPYPLDVNFVFQLSGISLILGAIIIYHIPREIERRSSQLRRK